MNTSLLKVLGSITLAGILCGHSAKALVPPANDNPTGAFGVFNGNSTTGCSYDPYTANATRTIPDLVVTNSVGRYPLTWARTMNSRDNGGGGDLGAGGGWRHSYQWKCTAEESPTTTPAAYTVYYSDGRVVRFTSANGFQGPLGVNDRFSPRTGNGDCYLMLSDGGQVHFTQTSHDVGDDYTFTFGSGATFILDPFSLPTTLSYDGSGRLNIAQDASGRFLKIYYDTSGQYPNQITKVDACNAAGAVLQEVTYGYSKQSFNGSGLYTLLTSATYRGDPVGVKATYSYQQSNVFPNQGTPLIQSCYDLRYPGPMKNIAYDFRGGSTYGVFLREKNAATNTTVVALTITSTNVRTEQRGDGATRTFTYGVPGQGDLNVPLPYELATVTDFEGKPTYYSYDAYGHMSNIRDALLRNTSFDRLALTGAITKITLPAETSAGGTRSTIQYTYQDSLTGYFLESVTNELGSGHTTTYASHPNGTVATTTTTYPDGGVETFTYNAMNQLGLTPEKWT